MSLASPAGSGVTASSIRSLLDQCIAERSAAMEVSNDQMLVTRAMAARSGCEDMKARLDNYHDDDFVEVAALRVPSDVRADFLPAELRSVFDSVGLHPTAFGVERDNQHLLTNIRTIWRPRSCPDGIFDRRKHPDRESQTEPIVPSRQSIDYIQTVSSSVL